MLFVDFALLSLFAVVIDLTLFCSILLEKVFQNLDQQATITASMVVTGVFLVIFPI